MNNYEIIFLIGILELLDLWTFNCPMFQLQDF